MDRGDEQSGHLGPTVQDFVTQDGHKVGGVSISREAEKGETEDGTCNPEISEDVKLVETSEHTGSMVNEEGIEDSDSEDERCSMKRPNLLEQLKTILDTYPDDAQIIKELIQNAEDASATEIKLLHDKRNIHPEGELGKYFKTPALCVYNDAEFTDDDWDGIISIYNSVKKNDKLKVGRFGLGFKSVFHLTDHPVIISGDKILVIDPLQSLKSEQEVCDKKRLKSLAKQKYRQSIAHLQNVFEINENILKGCYRGTFFWFSLRYKPSALSDNIYTEQKMVQLFDTFKEEAPMVVLFLKSLLRIETLCRCDDTPDQIHTLHTVSMTGSTKQLEKRTVFKNEVLELKGDLPVTSIWSTYEVTITSYNDNKGFETDWIVVNFIQGTSESPEKLTSLAQDPDLSYSPYVGVAYPRISNGTRETGHVYCFLPLPLEKKSITGLPVHVNGLFALEQNRKHVKWGNRDQSHLMITKDKHVMWNEMVISEVLSKAYENLVDYLIEKSLMYPSDKEIINDVVRSIPTLSTTSSNWEILLKNLVPKLLSKDIFYTENDGGKWISQDKAIFPLFSPAVISDEMETTITTFILLAGKNIVPLDNNMKEIIVDENYNRSPACGITPELLRDILHSCSEYKTLSRKDKFNLLYYATADKNYSELYGIELLPLSDGTFTNFQSASNKEDENIYLCRNGEETIFIGIGNRLVSTRDEIQVEVITLLEEIAESGTFQLQVLTEVDFPYLYQNTINEKCQQKENGYFTPVSDHINLNWLEKVWKYINNNFDVNGDLEMLHRLPLIAEKQPDNQSVEKLLPLRGFYLVANCDGMRTVSPCLDNIFKLFSITKFQAVPGFLKNILGTYVYYPNHESIFQLLSAVLTEMSEDKIIEKFNMDSLPSDKAALVDFLGENTEIIPSNLKSFFKHLQIFGVSQNTVGIFDRIPEFVSVTENNLLTPYSKFPVPYPYQMIGATMTKERELAHVLGAAEKELAELVKDVLEIFLSDTENKTYNREEVKVFMDYFLSNVTTFDGMILQTAQKVAFIPSSNTSLLHCAADLFDPRDKNLRILFYGEDKFPSQPYDSDDTLNALLKIGLKKSKDVTPDDILKSAKILDTLDSENNAKIDEYIAKAGKLKYFLNRLANEIEINILNEFKELRWVAVSKRLERYPNCLPWYCEDNDIRLSTPKDVISSNFYLLSGSVRCIVDVTDANGILEQFQWDQCPPEAVISKQLDCIAMCYEPKHRPVLLPIVASLYEHLYKLDSDYECFQETNCILCEVFEKPCEVYINEDTDYEDRDTETFNLYPYMSKLPAEFCHLKKLFIAFGCKEFLTSDILIKVLEKIKQKHSSKNKRAKSKRYVKSDLQLVLQIVKYLDGRLQNTQLKNVLLPVKTKKDCLVLKYPEECTYGDDDADWLFEATEEDIIEDDIFYVHKEINPEMAVRFGIPSLTNRFLTEDNSEDMVIEWGQSEPLTTRLNNLLEGYSDGFSIPKEIVQNADDAGATEVAFLYDERENKNTGGHLIDPEMAECQGPALWAYNDSIFEESDFKNIIKLGGRTKEMDESTIGKFGLGFCSVYNLTDVPSFYSGNSMVIFDPHGTYLGKALKNKNNPGLRFRLNRKIVKCLHSQFQPFHGVFDCSMKQNIEYRGTLFRLPLRTQKQAEKSQIKAMHYSRKEMAELIDIFTRSAGDLLLFTQNIKSIKVFHLPPTSTNPVMKTLLFSADKLSQMSIPKHMNDKHVLKYFLSNPEDELSVINQFKISVNITEHINRLCTRKASSNETVWLIAWGSSSSKDRTLQAIKGGLPIGATAVPVSVTDGKLHLAEIHMLPDGFYNSSHLFCFLPLPVDVKLLFHLNGCFSVEQDRKCLTRKSEDEKMSEKVQWNNYILSGAVCNAFVNLLTSLRDLVSNTEYEYSILWPQLSSNDRELAEFFKSFYRNLVQGDYKLLNQDGQWYSFKECCFLDPFLRFDEDIGDIAFDCLLQFAEERKVVHMREDVLKCLDVAGCRDEFQERVIQTETFYDEIFFKYISSNSWLKTKQKILERDKLTMFALKSKNKTLMELVHSNECIPTRGKGTLKRPEDLIHPNKLAASLFDDNDERFPTQFFCETDSLDALLNLGMKSDHIPFEWVKERANTIRCLSEDIAMKRCESLLEYIRCICLQKNDHGYTLSELSDIEFLPVDQKPANWPLTWKGDSVAVKDNTETVEIFTCPKQLYFQKRKLLIGAIKKIVNQFDTHRYVGVLKEIGVKDDVTVDGIFQQLEIVSECSIENMTEAEKEELKKICLAIYHYLNDIYKDGNEELVQKFETLHSKKIILTLDREGKEVLIKPSEIAFNRPTNSQVATDCRPYLYFVDHSMKRYTGFLKMVGIKEEFSPSFILSTVEECKENFGDGPCSNRDAILIVSIIKLLSETCKQAEISLSDDEIKNLIVPDADCILRSPCDLCYDEDYGSLGKMSFMHFVHSSVDVGLMKMLGIKSKRTQHLKSFAGAMDFGQKEKLVTRLKGLLEGYPFDSTILNELLQNADDAFASEIHFILDERTHTESGIFDDSWKPLQGPSLLVYNDTCFTASDIQGIQNLGEGNKSDDPTKTGQFGLGFNATYHLTDVPSFLTRGPDTPNGGTLCIFDPHCNYAPVARPESPGMQLPDLSEIQRHYPGVYNTYLQDEIPSDIGTWFRFPLRDREMAKKSEICKNKAITSSEIQELFDVFLNDMQRSLLFVSNVQEIKLSRISRTGRRFVGPFYRVKALLTDDDKRKRERFNQYVKVSMARLRSGKCLLTEIPFQEVVYRLTIEDNSTKRTNWIVVQRFGVSKNIPDLLIKAVKNGDIGLAPRGGIALPVIDETKLQSTSKVKRSKPKKKQKFLPTVDALNIYKDMLQSMNTPKQINIGDQKILYNTDKMRNDKPKRKKIQINEQAEMGDFKVFCFLPTPIRSGLPLHINGHFVLDPARRNMFRDGDKQSLKGEWNVMILNDILPKAYIKGMEGLRDYLMDLVDNCLISSSNAISMYHWVFPNQTDILENRFESLVNGIYQNIVEEEACLFPVQNCFPTVVRDSIDTVTWFPLMSNNDTFPVYFDSLLCQFEAVVNNKYKHIQLTEDNKHAVERLKCRDKQLANTQSINLAKLLKSIGLKLVESPLWILQAITTASITAKCVEPDDVTLFIKSHLENSPDRCRIEVLDSGNTEDLKTKVRLLLSYCLKSSSFLEYMEKLPLLFTENNELQYFSSSRPVYVSHFCKLLPNSKDLFANADLVDLLTDLIDKSKSLRMFDIKSFAALLSQSVDENVFKNSEGISKREENDSIPNEQWLWLFWQYLSVQPTDKMVRDCFNFLKDWCLIPGEEDGKKVLVSFEHSHRLINLRSFSTDHSQRKTAFCSLQLPKSNFCGFNETIQRFLANEQNPLSILKCLLYSVDRLRKMEIKDETCNEILKYLHGNVKLDKDTERKLRKLPLYSSISGSHTSLDRGNRMLIYPRDIPTDGLNDWSDKADLLLLKPNSITEPLLESLGAQKCDSLELYGQYLLPKFDLLDREFTMTHMKYIRDKLIGYYKGDISKVLREQLKLTSFIPALCNNNVLVRADTFYSPFNNVCKKMCHESEFPTPPFNEKEWRNLMEIAGMKNEITEDLFVKFAKQIEDGGMKKGVTKTVKEQSEELVSHLFKERKNLELSGLLDRIKHIKFIVPYVVPKVYSNIYPVVKSQSLICFYKSISHKYTDISWTVCSLLPQYADPKFYIKDLVLNKIEGRLGIDIVPQIENVILHAKNICPAFERTCLAYYQKGKTLQPDRNTMGIIMEHIYTYLNNNVQEKHSAELCETPIIHVYDHDLFCLAEQVVLDISSEDEILPYLFKAPVKFGASYKLFETLGSKHKLSCHHYANVLTAQKRVVRESCLSPEDLSVTRRAVLGFFKGAKKDIKQIKSIDCLYLPGEDNKLHKAASLVHCNKKSYKTRLVQLVDIKYLHEMDFSEERVYVESIFPNLPDKVRPKILTNLVKEELVQVSMNEIVADSENVSAIERFISSSQFLKVVCYLIRHDNQKSSDQVTDQQLAEIRQNIKSIEFHAVRHLETILRYEGNIVQGSKQQIQCYYTTSNGIHKFFFQEGQGDIGKRIRSRLARLILQCTNKLIKDQSFNCLSEIVGFVPDTRLIAPYLTEHDINIDAEFEYIEDEWLPPLGSYVPKDVYVLLDNDFTEFRNGEYIAYEVYDPKIDCTEAHPVTEDLNDPVYIYAKVIEKCDSVINGEATNPYLVRYKVNFGHGKIENVCVIRLYKFVRKNSTDVVEYTGKQAHYDEAREEEVMRRIRKTLIDAWKLSDEKTRKRIIKRLLLFWHPDKNKGNEEFCTKVFQYIQEIIRQLENGEININSGSGPSYSSWTFTRDSHAYSGTWYSTFGENVRTRYHSSWTSYHETYGQRRRSRSRHRQKTEYVYVPNPQAHEAKRWLKQAKNDLVVAIGILDCSCENLVDKDTYNWICFIAHQAAEKAIIAITYSVDANKVSRVHQLRVVASSQPRDSLKEKAAKLDDHLGHYNRMRYPDAFNYPSTPTELYDEEKAKEAVKQAQEIIEEVDEYLS